MVKPSALRLESLLDQAAEPFQRLLQESLQQLLEAQLTQFVGAAPGERTQARTGYRAGHVKRRIATRAGTLELRVPRDRARRFSTELLERYPRSEKALVAALGQMFVRGCKTANVKAVAEELCGHAFSGSTLQLIEKGFDAALARYECGMLERAYPRLILQARHERVRVDRMVRSQVVLMAIGIDGAGRRRTLGAELANRASRASWTALLHRLKHSGLHGVQRVVGDDRDGLRQAVRKTWGQGLVASSRGTLVARRAHRSAARDPRSDSDRDIVASPAIAYAPPDATGRPEVLGYAARSEADRPEAQRATGPDPRSRADSQRSKVLAVLAGAVGAMGLLFWGMGPVVDPPQDIVSAATTELHGAPRHAEPAPALAPPAPAAPQPATTAPMRSRFLLSGVAAARTPGGPGIALIAIDGGSPNVYRVGATVYGDLVLKGVTWDRATLGPARGPVTVVLDVTAPAAPSPAVAQAVAGRMWNVAGASPSALASAGTTLSAAPDAYSMVPMTVAMGDVQQTTAMSDGVTLVPPASGLEPESATQAQVLSSSPPPARRHRSRRLNAPR